MSSIDFVVLKEAKIKFDREMNAGVEALGIALETRFTRASDEPGPINAIGATVISNKPFPDGYKRMIETLIQRTYVYSGQSVPVVLDYVVRK